MKALFLVVLFISSLDYPPVFNAHKGVLKVQVTNFKPAKGHILVSVYNKASGFPSKPNIAFKNLRIPVNNATENIEIPDLPFGTYAIVAVHDVNSNGKLDFNALGIPKEAIGASNNARKKFGPPDYKDAKFDFSNSGQQINFSMK
jgi:uncharacterized protein (DUF2141 family)